MFSWAINMMMMMSVFVAVCCQDWSAVDCPRGTVNWWLRRWNSVNNSGNDSSSCQISRRNFARISVVIFRHLYPSVALARLGNRKGIWRGLGNSQRISFGGFWQTQPNWSNFWRNEPVKRKPNVHFLHSSHNHINYQQIISRIFAGR